MYLVLKPHCMTEILAKECKSGISSVLALGTVHEVTTIVGFPCGYVGDRL